MPELPEVETIKLGLERRIIGLKINQVEVLNPKSFQGNPNSVRGKKVVGIFRRGKVLGLNLLSSRAGGNKLSASSSTRNINQNVGWDRELAGSGKLVLLFHLKMSGQIIFVPKNRSGKRQNGGPARQCQSLAGGHPNQDMQSDMPVKSTRVVFTFSSGDHLYFNDQRKFGWVKVVDHKLLAVDRFLSNLGPEPLQDDFSFGKLKTNLYKHKSSPIKNVILDQSVVAGVGNIYACEALFLAGISPKRQVVNLSDPEIKKLFLSIQIALKAGIEYGGSSRTHFVNAEGGKGSFLQFAKVYNRVRQSCLVCGLIIKKVKLGGRGTYFCPGCQR